MFTSNEIEYLRAHMVGRLATVDSKGRPHVVPTGIFVGADDGTIEIGAANLPDRGQKRLYLTHLRANPYAAVTIDDVTPWDDSVPWGEAGPKPPGLPRGLVVRGAAHVHDHGGERLAPGFGPLWVEIIPDTVSSWGIDTSPLEPPNFRKRSSD